ncbi:M17 family peptidase N-terminal domain-containing protein, partial [Cellulomonas sp. 179-A 4D5 NHS]|uniref:M17 family peptidase N-terminal domain-containing protein n=1 Tax=Cellulomonas sp. 179-A 4D5 NHS TaxID=3142378 RepID=UPI0039A2D811
MPRATLTSQDPAHLDVDALVVGVARTDQGPRLLDPDALPKEVRTEVTAHAVALGISGDQDEVRRLPSAGRLKAGVLVLTGVGPLDAVTPEALRRAAGAATRELAGVA